MGNYADDAFVPVSPFFYNTNINSAFSICISSNQSPELLQPSSLSAYLSTFSFSLVFVLYANTVQME